MHVNLASHEHELFARNRKHRIETSRHDRSFKPHGNLYAFYRWPQYIQYPLSSRLIFLFLLFVSKYILILPKIRSDCENISVINLRSFFYPQLKRVIKVFCFRILLFKLLYDCLKLQKFNFVVLWQNLKNNRYFAFTPITGYIYSAIKRIVKIWNNSQSVF